MTYDPFRRGAHPVGVRTVDLVDEARDRKLVAEVWYPTDVAGPAPLAVFSSCAPRSTSPGPARCRR